MERNQEKEKKARFARKVRYTLYTFVSIGNFCWNEFSYIRTCLKLSMVSQFLIYSGILFQCSADASWKERDQKNFEFILRDSRAPGETFWKFLQTWWYWIFHDRLNNLAQHTVPRITFQYRVYILALNGSLWRHHFHPYLNEWIEEGKMNLICIECLNCKKVDGCMACMREFAVLKLYLNMWI